ncbi:LuxR C-terminal-related transcriptional regulator [Zavarzinia aquatilis]|uniref:HTH luxR-type domain-containing protein n=1 Tax=Zavarzinia aquatilis TaxID=2211142 RepID=A0A317E035_9PROT|nr:LuxR C-terminal-related transcriptional regulator [Zavarzinia aquatilis]PWR19496.1 hypothetical protein DKG74_17040 [Zavarzinia aquatilis]
MGRNEKFCPPTFNTDLLKRSRLLDALTASMVGNTVTLVVAPTGSGKSALLAQGMELWRRRGGRAVWYACDHFDAEAGRFVSMLEDALTEAEGGEGTGRSAIEVLMSAHDPKGLADAIVARGQRVVLFIDNFHLCDSEETSAALDLVIRDSRGLLHVVIGARRGPKLALGHLSVRGLVGQIGAEDLAFSPAEARAFIGHDCGAHADAVDRVIRRTEGWAAGLQLVRLLLAGGVSPRLLAEDFSGADQDIGHFLNQEVFRTLPGPLREFLLLVAPLDTLSADLSVAVTGLSDARRLFHEVQERNLFVVRLDRQGSQIRLHAIFADFLSKLAAEHDPALAGRSLRRAAAWHRERGHWIEAIDYAFRGGETDRAAEWLAACAPEVLSRRGETARFLSCAERLPAAAAAHPDIAFWRTWAALFSGEYDRAGELMDERNLERLRQHDPEGGQLGLLRFLVAYFTHRYVEALALGKSWLELGSGGSAFDRATVLVAMALCHRTQLDMAGAMRHLDLARHEIARSRTSYGQAWVATLSAQFFLAQGRPAVAAREIEDMLAQNRPSELMCGSAELVLADAYYERDQLDNARLLIRRSLPSIAQHGNIDVALGGWRVAARLAILGADAAAGLDLLRGVEPLSIRRFGMPALKLLHLVRDEIILDLDQEARRSLDFIDVCAGAEGEPDTPEAVELQRLVNAKRHLVSGHPRRAVADVLPILAATKASGRWRLWVRAACVKAAAHQADGEATFALRTIMEAIEKAATQGLVRSIVDHGAILRPLGPAIARHVASAPSALAPEAIALAERLTGALSPAPRVEDETLGVAGARLSTKERQVLAMVSQGLTNTEIMERLFVSLPTVKWHLRNIFDKLDVRTRTAAVARARSIGMLP